MTRAQVRNLEERSAQWVAKHLVMAGRLIDLDPELAFQHALAASRRGGRLAAVREAVGVTAYAAGHYGEALREFRTFRRISGSNVHLPVMADCERGLGRPDRALDLARGEEAQSLDAAGKAELAMVVSGARADLGQLEAAVAALEIPQLDLHRAFPFSPRLFRAYADALDAVGRSQESGTWRRQASVAEKALGLDDESEPDIIDLGDEDEDGIARPVPKVADVLGAPALEDTPGANAGDTDPQHTVATPTPEQPQETQSNTEEPESRTGLAASSVEEQVPDAATGSTPPDEQPAIEERPVEPATEEQQSETAALFSMSSSGVADIVVPEAGTRADREGGASVPAVEFLTAEAARSTSTTEGPATSEGIGAADAADSPGEVGPEQGREDGPEASVPPSATGGKDSGKPATASSSDGTDD